MGPLFARLNSFCGRKPLKTLFHLKKCSLAVMDQSVKLSRDKRVAFSEHDHRYIRLDTGKQLVSSTTLIKKFKAPFETDVIAKRYATKHGRDAEEVKKEWSDKANIAATKGTFVHKMLEDLGNGIAIEPSGRYPEETWAFRFYQDFYASGYWTPVALEEILWSETGLAGQADAIVKNRYGDYVLLDYKTSKKIARDNEYGRKMKLDFKDLDDCEYNHYSIQLSLYKMMCKQFPISDLVLIHIRPDGYSLEHAKDFKFNEEQVKKWLEN